MSDAPAAVDRAEGGRRGAVAAKVVLFTLAVIGFFVLVGFYVARIVGSAGASGAAAGAPATGVSPEVGEAVFWGKGKCSTCHSLGDRGSAVRCPNLLDIGGHTDERARAAGLADGTAYLVESLHDPSAYVVAGYSGDTMPKVFQPPISLSGDEIRAVITYLQSQGGTVDAAAIQLPPDMEGGPGGAPAPAGAWKPYLAGDAANGEKLFRQGRTGVPPCAACHTVAGEGATVGPDLTDVAVIRGPQYIISSIVDPKAEVVSGYQPVMPPNFADILTVREIHDLLAYLMQSAGLPPDGGAPPGG
jgi:mono/diheme cytochrome c family protein